MGTRPITNYIARMIGGLLVAIFAGRFIDQALNTEPFIMIVLLLYVVVGSLYQLIRELGGLNAK